jgi:hypothetical protein
MYKCWVLNCSIDNRVKQLSRVLSRHHRPSIPPSWRLSSNQRPLKFGLKDLSLGWAGVELPPKLRSSKKILTRHEERGFQPPTATETYIRSAKTSSISSTRSPPPGLPLSSLLPLYHPTPSAALLSTTPITMTEVKSSGLGFLTDNAIISTLKDTYNVFSERRGALGLSNPGTVENIAREVQKDVLLSNFMFTGFRADVTKVFSMTPLFRISHAFAMGSQGGAAPYSFAAMYGTPQVWSRRNTRRVC